ncbi:MAG: hypothetical protein E7D61_08020 [Staphylococcus lugdunensis]|nr:hypothetical protein [Staphylococcus lugdunensis]
MPALSVVVFVTVIDVPSWPLSPFAPFGTVTVFPSLKWITVLPSPSVVVFVNVTDVPS